MQRVATAQIELLHMPALCLHQRHRPQVGERGRESVERGRLDQGLLDEG
ncbi:hypothetical protein [Propioniciclava flava]